MSRKAIYEGLVGRLALLICGFPPHLVRPIVFPQPDVNRVPQKVVCRPGQIVISATSFGSTQ
jgi:hypothetical protein